MPIILKHIEPGYCTCESVYAVIKEGKVEGVKLTKKSFPRWFSARKDIPFTKDVVTWEISPGRTKLSRGLDVEGFEVALDVLHRTGYFKAGEYRYPELFGLDPATRCVVEETPSTEWGLEPDKLLREKWSDTAKSTISRAIKERDLSISELAEHLVDLACRRPGLEDVVLQRQIDRMVGDYYTAEQLLEYKKVHLPNSRAARRGILQERAMFERESNTLWEMEDDSGLCVAAMDPKFKACKTGTATFKKLARVYRKMGLRKASPQAIRKRLSCLVAQNFEGITRERFDELNHTRGRFDELNHTRGQKSPEPVSVESGDLVETSGGNVVVEVRGLFVTLTPELQKKALEEYLTPGMMTAAFEAFVNKRLG